MRMQLSGERSIRRAVAALTAALLGPGAATAAAQDHTETSILLYSESQRVTALEGVFNVDKKLAGPYSLSLGLTYDGLTGATPTGATPSKQAQTFTGPSGRGVVTIPAGQTPLDHSFKDARYAAEGSLSRALDRLTTMSLGGHFSGERDYLSFGVNSGLTRDFFRKNTTLGLSGSYSHDVVSAIGGAPIPFSVQDTASSQGGGNEGDGVTAITARRDRSGKLKDVFDAMFGLSQVLDRKTILRMNYSYDRATGYLNDPYKVLTLVQNADSSMPGEPVNNVYENRPSRRRKNALYAEIRRYIAGNTIDLSYRYFWDDWGVISRTIDATYRWRLDSDLVLQPHVRWYRQSQANFYHPFLVGGAPLPTYASADTRLAGFDALTFGLKYSFPVAEGSRLSLTAEYYYQKGDRSPPEAFGTLRGYDLFPQANAVMLRISYGHDF
jgi:hypothetical protein